MLFFVSGCTGLMYEVLWLKELRLLFGSTAAATASTLAIFFLGLALGGYVWGRQDRTARYPLRTYALLELGIGLSAVAYFVLRDAYALVYTPLFARLGHGHVLVTVVKFVLALSLLLPAAFCMGGTFPVMGQLLIRGRQEFGRIVTVLYGVNTLGAAVGAFAAGFYLPVVMGFRLAYVLVITLNLLIAAVTWLLSSRYSAEVVQPDTPPQQSKAARQLAPRSSWRLAVLACGSGLLTLGLEVVWTQMFAQVLMNDVYSFATILITFLVALACGGFLAHAVSRLSSNPWRTLYGLALAAGLAVGVSPLLFYAWTHGLEALTAVSGWGSYVLALCGLAAAVMLVPGILLGSLFPTLLKLAVGSRRTVAETLGVWTAVNTIGAVLGAVIAGFVLLPGLGLWASLGLIAALYCGLALLALQECTGIRKGRYGALVLGCMLVCAGLPVLRLPTVKLDTANREVVRDVWYGRQGVVSVLQAHPPYYPVEHPGDLLMRMNNHYTLGGLGSLPDEQRQAHLPLWLHPEPRSVFFLGLATGISVGGALYHPLKRVVVCELVPEVVVAAQQYFAAHNNGVFSDPRVSLVVEDGRQYLRGTAEAYDVIIGDLFNVWGAGVGNLYTLEHFRTVRERLHAGGLFAQWLPLYQVSQREFGIIVRTMLEVFPQVTLWRGNFVSEKPIVALIGHTDTTPLQPDTLLANVHGLRAHDRATEVLTNAFVRLKGVDPVAAQPERQALTTQLLPHVMRTVPLTFYAGNLTAHKALFQAYPLNTDNRPVLEFVAPKTPGEQGEGRAAWLTMQALTQLFEQFGPLEQDSYLQQLTPEQRDYVRAGLSYYKHVTLHRQAQLLQRPELLKEAQRWLSDYVDKLGLRRPELVLSQ